MNKLIGFLLLFSTTVFAADKSSNFEKKINAIYDKKAQIDLELNQADENVKQIESRLREKRKVLLQRAQALNYIKNYKWGNMLAVSNPIQFERNFKILSRLNQYDLNLFKDYKASLRNLAQGRQDLVAYQKELQAIIEDLQKREVAQHEKDLQRQQQMILENKKSLLLFKGQLPRPTEGQLRLRYGSQRDDQNQYSFMIHGLLFTTTAEQNVRAVGPGEVIFRDQIKYWGETLIIKHDDDYYSVYAGITPHLKTVGDQVQMNDVIGLTKNNEFYFELRHFENPINPKNWLAKDK
ncbi:MAG: peptidoglycan DD-metalloendopeptidase family protein [Bdellovibrio sp.]|nr:peptidoglycan DD-metalloendopeptidase family protein [Bdellovibrio sp.]